jgi:hypothetical protein
MQSTGSTPIPERFSSVFGLGAPIALYRASNGARWGRAIVGVLMVGAAGLIGLYGIYNTMVQTERHGPAVFQGTLFPPVIIALIVFALGAGLAVSAFLNWNKAVVLYDNGLAYNDRGGVQTWRWEEVSQFFIAITRHYSYGIHTGTTYLYTLRKQDGSQIRLANSFAKIQELGKAIQQKVFPFQYESLVKALKSGATVTLGPVALNRDGIEIGKKNFPWAEVEEVGIQRGFVSVKKKAGGWFSGATASVASIPNLEAMLAAVEQIVKVKAG